VASDPHALLTAITDRAQDRLSVVPGSRVDLLPGYEAVAQVHSVGADLLNFDAADAATNAAMQQHHQRVPAQVDEPLRLVGQITEGVLLGPDEDSNSIASPVGRFQIERHTGTDLHGNHRIGRIPRQREREVAPGPGSHRLQERVAKHRSAQARAAEASR
jgi:hypothetical protein